MAILGPVIPPIDSKPRAKPTPIAPMSSRNIVPDSLPLSGSNHSGVEGLVEDARRLNKETLEVHRGIVPNLPGGGTSGKSGRSIQPNPGEGRFGGDPERPEKNLPDPHRELIEQTGSHDPGEDDRIRQEPDPEWSPPGFPVPRPVPPTL